MGQKLVLFTTGFPYGQAESFIENEIEFLAAKFQEVTIFPQSYAGSTTRPVPENCKILQPVFLNNIDLLLKGIFCLAPLLWFINHYFQEKAYRSFSKTAKYIVTSIRCRAILANKDFKSINNATDQDILYFYWGIGFAYILPFIKNPKTKIVRFHGTDLYLERRKNRYIPFRKEVYSNLTKAVFISKQGMEYALKTWHDIPFSAYLGYLGTKDHGIRPPHSSDNTIRILSCSYVIKLKRIDRILEALLLIKNYNIEWTHIGDGEELQNLRNRLRQLPANLKVHLTSGISNPEVIKFYQNNSIDLFVNVSTTEGLPVALMEAISFDIPVLASNVGGTSEIVTPESGMLIAPDFKNQELANAIVTLYKNRELYHPRQLWEKAFNAEKNYNTFIDDVLKSPSTSDNKPASSQ